MSSIRFVLGGYFSGADIYANHPLGDPVQFVCTRTSMSVNEGLLPYAGRAWHVVSCARESLVCQAGMAAAVIGRLTIVTLATINRARISPKQQYLQLSLVFVWL